MEWVRAISQLVGSVAWPAAVVILILVFRREVRHRLTSIAEVKYPGGSITMKDVEILEAKVERTTNVTPGAPALPQSDQITEMTRSDAHLSIAHMRLEAEKEIFRLTWMAQGQKDVTGWHIRRHIDELQKAAVLPSDLADNLRSFMDVADRMVHDSNVPEELMLRSAAVGGSLVSALRHKRLVWEAEKDFEGHGLWHMHHHIGNEEHQHFYFWSAVAAQLPMFDYSYDIYREAVERHNGKCADSGYGREIYVLPLGEFVSVLEFREAELLRLIPVWSEGWEEFKRANEWHWPKEWGRLGWSGPILRQGVSLYDAEQDLMRTRAALDHHRAVQIASLRPKR